MRLPGSARSWPLALISSSKAASQGLLHCEILRLGTMCASVTAFVVSLEAFYNALGLLLIGAYGSSFFALKTCVDNGCRQPFRQVGSQEPNLSCRVLMHLSGSFDFGGTRQRAGKINIAIFPPLLKMLAIHGAGKVIALDSVAAHIPQDRK